MSQSHQRFPGGNRPRELNILTSREDNTLFILKVGYIFGALIFAFAILVTAGCSSKSPADIDLGLKAKIGPEPSIQTAPAPSISRNSDQAAPVTGKPD